MNNFERITASPEALGDFLGALPKLDDIGKKLFYTAAEAAALAKSMTEKYERTWGWIGAPEIPMARPWEKLLEVPANG